MRMMLPSTDRSHWRLTRTAITLAAGAAVAGFLSAQNGSIVDIPNNIRLPAEQRTTVIYKDADGAWPSGHVWIGRADCSRRDASGRDVKRCAVVIDTTKGINV